MKKLVCSLFLLISLCNAGAAASAGDGDICERQMSGAAVAEGVPLGVLYAVAMTETGRKGALHPYALNIEGRTVLTTTKQDALAEFDRARRSGKKLIDLGCMQVNHHYHGQAFASVSAMLDPALNVRYAARFLKDLRQKEGSWAMAVARYHAGPDNDPAQKRYICAVIRNLVATGFGAWTPASRKFCR
ncbi:MAG: transglycosylase SLT domain-containing protein [Aestuariivirga sp.]|uniref:transglycosylase SLT domain-containing protein n=1 Tax=Aestuariivirga sp. TaxID=2650926 RepID=UPI0025C1B916|nr:transglycosylase SLT domain-containing protein [Aestuariivirga sp.]MCA3561399.1 transglycosylase SLT domain-containing protein [Aestuariivirga sp.]